MPAWPDAPAVEAFLARARRRVAWLAAANGAAGGLVLAMVLVALGWVGRGSIVSATGAGVLLASAGAGVSATLARASRRNPAALVERRVPECRNLLVTAAELIDQPARVCEYMGARVSRDAARLVARLDLPRLIPARRTVAACAVSTTLFAVSVLLTAGRPAASAVVTAPDAASIAEVDVVVTAPAYAGRPVETLRDPSRITALAGSRIQLRVTADATAVALETLGGRRALTSDGRRAFAGEMLADADGFLAIEPAASTGRAGLRRLIGLSVEADRPPRVRVTAPGKDLFLPDARRSLDLAADADDDIGLVSLRLRYTKVAGSGENFTFSDGEVPLDLSRPTPQAWHATGALRLAALDLSPGDMVVYRAVATDGRPGAPPAESDSWVVEITAPGAVAMEGFAVDDERDRYALSEQMVIMKTEQLAARRASLSSEAFADEAQGLAAEQRRVRAEFVFMMGGELADAGVDTGELHEEAEAVGESDLAAGRLANQGRVDLLRAIRSMSLAATSLNTAALAPALTDERAALAALQRAFARSRYILRTLTERERLDLSRRLTGVLAALVRDARPTATAPDNARLADLRRALAGIATLAGTTTFAPDDAARATTLAEQVLRVDPSAPELSGIAARLTEAAAAIATGRQDDVRALLDRAATDLAAGLRTELVDAPLRQPTPDAGRLDGLLADALKGRRK